MSKHELKRSTRKRDKLAEPESAACDNAVTLLQKWGRNCSRAGVIDCGQKILNKKYIDYHNVIAQ